jgi:aryl-alcohol dehydrogenase-like predicted oxidoreductase
LSFIHSFGATGRQVSRVGLGGEGVLRTFGRTRDAQAVILEALSCGITYFDSARAYAGSEGYYGSLWLDRPKQAAQVFKASKSASRDRAGALVDLDQSLTMMGLQSLDLWQIHDIRTKEDLLQIEANGGALEAFLHAREVGLVGAIGATAHQDPQILTYAATNWDIDSVLMPVNPVEGVLGGFLDSTLEAATSRGIAIVGMKALGASHYINTKDGVTPAALIRFSLSQEIDVLTVGCSTPQEVRTLADAGKGFKKMPLDEQHDLLDIFRPYARRLAFYRGH